MLNNSERTTQTIRELTTKALLNSNIIPDITKTDKFEIDSFVRDISFLIIIAVVIIPHIIPRTDINVIIVPRPNK